MRIPVRKSLWWAVYHRSDLVWTSILALLGGAALLVLAFKNMPKSNPSGIALFIMGTYGIYYGVASAYKLFKELTR